MAARFGHRLRWTIAIVLLASWPALLVMNIGGAAANLVLAAAIAVTLYELLAAERAER